MDILWEMDITGREAGIRSVIQVDGAFAFGKLSCETECIGWCESVRLIPTAGGIQFCGGGCDSGI